MRKSGLLLLALFLFTFVSSFSSSKAQSATATLEATLSLNDVNGIKVPYQNGFPLPSFEKQKRTIIDLSGEWKKQRFEANDTYTLSKRDAAGLTNIETEAANRHKIDYDDSAWETKHLPGVENKLNPAPTAPEILQATQDGVWYRRTFTVDASHTGKFVKLNFYAVNYIADVWLNNIYLGYHEGGHTPFSFDVSQALNYGGSNTLVVRVHNVRWGSTKSIVPYNTPDWFNYSGIYHDVYLEMAEPVSVIRANVVTKDLNGTFDATVVLYNKKNEAASVETKIEIYEADINDTNIQAELAHELIGSAAPFTGENQKNISINAASASAWKTTLQISNPKIWSPKNPNLYVLKVTLTEAGKVVDEFYTQFGIRTIGTKANKFLLNNRIMFFTGAARHEEHPDYGRAVPKNIIYSDLLTVKSLNVNFLRTAHYPNHLYTYLIADRLGLTIMEEIPVFWFDTADAWQHQEQRRITYQMFREMVFKDYNRPSIILWSTSNECLDVTNRAVYNQNIVNDQRQNYYDGRLISQSAAADRPGPSDASQAPLDVAGWTIYFGIFHPFNGRVRFDEAFGGTFDFLNKARTAYPSKPIIDTEFGYWSTENPDMNTYQKQVTLFDETFKAFKIFAAVNPQNQENTSLGALMASTWWCVFDWYQFRNDGGYQTMGLISMDRTFQKPVANALKTAYLPYYNIDGVLTDVKEAPSEIPRGFKLNQNYPNPFNPETTIGFSLPQAGFVSLKIYDLIGRLVTTLVNEYMMPGEYAFKFSASELNLSGGVYFYRLQAGTFAETKRMLFLK